MELAVSIGMLGLPAYWQMQLLPSPQPWRRPLQACLLNVQENINRVIVDNLGSPAWELASPAASPAAAPADPARSLVQCVVAVKQIVRRSHSAAMVSFPAGAAHIA